MHIPELHTAAEELQITAVGKVHVQTKEFFPFRSVDTENADAVAETKRRIRLVWTYSTKQQGALRPSADPASNVHLHGHRDCGDVTRGENVAVPGGGRGGQTHEKEEGGCSGLFCG